MRKMRILLWTRDPYHIPTVQLLNTYNDCRSCTEQTCMKECGRHLYIPEEIGRVYRLLRAGSTSSKSYYDGGN